MSGAIDLSLPFTFNSDPTNTTVPEPVPPTIINNYYNNYYNHDGKECPPEPGPVTPWDRPSPFIKIDVNGKPYPEVINNNKPGHIGGYIAGRVSKPIVKLTQLTPANMTILVSHNMIPSGTRCIVQINGIRDILESLLEMGEYSLHHEKEKVDSSVCTVSYVTPALIIRANITLKLMISAPKSRIAISGSHVT
jgi:hypothetical protein